MNNSIKLQANSILQIPFDNYPKDFVFIVNGKTYKTMKFCADLLSTKISKMHQIDPTLNEYSFNTNTKGDFQLFLDILNFNQKDLEEQDIPFITEIICILCTENIEYNIKIPEININNAINLIRKHEKSAFFYSKILSEEIEYLSSHFYELKDEQLEEISEISIETIEEIIGNEKLALKTEDQLLTLINLLYSKSSTYSNLYEYVYFENISHEKMKEFISIFSIEWITQGTWMSISNRLLNDKSKEIEKEQSKRYHFSEMNKKEEEKKNDALKVKEIPYLNSKNLKGIFNYFKQQSSIQDEVAVSQSSFDDGDVNLFLDIENTKGAYYTKDVPNSWICIELKKHRLIPTNYTIRNYNGVYNLKSWVIEVSNDKNNWIKVDEQNEKKIGFFRI